MFHRCLSRLAVAAAACLILFISLPAVNNASAAGNIIRAAEGGSFSSTCGADWAHPCDLQYALTVRAQPGDEIWVKAGTYYPTTNSTDRNASFLLRGGINLYGGFAGNETERSQRDWETNRTILSGDIDHNDLASPAETADQIVGGNSLHVVYAYDVIVDTYMDGFIITAGLASSTEGGGVVISVSGNNPPPPGTAHLSNVHIMGSRARDGGGVFFSHSGTLTDAVVSGCAADQEGGGIGIYGELELTRVTISGNTSVGGGGMLIEYGAPVFTDLTFTGNTAAGNGGGLYTYYSAPAITGSTFKDNFSGLGGGAAFFDNSTVQVWGSTFENNRTDGNGGAIHNNYSILTLRDSLMAGNSALNGGAMYSYENIADLTNVTVTGNTASGQGGGFYLDSSDPASVQVMKHLTVTDNDAANDGGIYLTGAKPPEVYNSIVWGNSDATYEKRQITDTASVRNSVIEGGFFGGVNIRIDNPLLGTLSDVGGSVRVLPLLPGSPAADFADAAYCPDADARGIARPQGPGCDAGAYESRPFQVTVLGGDGQSTPLNRLFPQPLEMDVTSAYGEPVDGGRLSVSFLSEKFKYDAADLTISNGKATVWARAGSTEGSHTVWFSPSFTATPGGPGSAAFNLTNTPAVFAVFRVALNGGSELSCGDRWDNPCSLEKAMALSIPGDEIWVKAGTYRNPTEKPINLPKGVALYGGFAGTETTREARDWKANVTILSGDTDHNDLANPITDLAQIKGRNSMSVVSGWGCGQVTLDGFTITGASSQSGIRMRYCNATLRNLIIQGNMSDEGGGFYDEDSTLLLNNVTFRYNHASDYGGGVFAKGSLSIRMENVTFEENTAGYDGGGAWYATSSDSQMKNVSFIGNVAGNSGGGLWVQGMEIELNGGMFSGNQAAMGGGVYFEDGPLELNVENITFSGNSATVSGGAMMLDFCSSNSSCAFRHLTMVGNEAPSGGGVYLKAGFYEMYSSILWNNTPDQIFAYRDKLDVANSIIEGGLTGGMNIITADPLLAALANYGGGTQTFALLPGSPAIDSGQSSSCSATDQRGVTRPQGSGCDLGAFESRGFTLTVSDGAAQSTLVNQPFANPLAVIVNSAANEPVEGGLVTFTPPAQGASAVITGSPARITGERAAVTAQANNTGGTYHVTAGGPGILPESFHLTNLPALVPTLNAIEPAGVWEDGPAFTLTVTGENFAPGAVIRWNSIALDTVVVDANTLRAEIPAEWIEIPREVQITVENPEPGGGESGVVVFTVYERMHVFLPVMVGE